MRSLLVDAGNKSTAVRSKLLRGTMKLFDAKLHQTVRSRKLYFNLQRFWKIVV